jgi:hypothetical protein
VAHEKIAADLSAVYYAATLTPDPTLDPEANPEALAAYHARGHKLASTLLTPERQALIRCPCGTRAAHPNRPARVIATVNDHNLLVVWESRAYPDHHLRLLTHAVVDLELAKGQGFHSVRVYCYDCGALHELGFGWLHGAKRTQHSTPCEKFALNPSGDPITQEGYPPPRSPNDAGYIAFAETIGPLDGSPLLVTVTFPYAVDYRNHFGFKPPHEEHLLRLMGDGDPRTEVPPEFREIITPQWRRLQLDPEERSEEQFDGPLEEDELQALQQLLAEQDDPREREDFLLTMQQLLQEDDFTALQRSLIEETP